MVGNGGGLRLWWVVVGVVVGGWLTGRWSWLSVMGGGVRGWSW